MLKQTNESKSISQAVLSMLVCFTLALPLNMAVVSFAHALSVNGQTISSQTIKKRSALLRLRKQRSGRSNAINELIDDTIKLQEAKRLGVLPSQSEVNQAYAKFAKNNRLTVSKLNAALTKSGVATSEFKAYIRAQMAWPRVVAAKAKKERANVSQDKILRDLRTSGKPKPSTQEYFLQQVIFVVPAKKRSRLAKRKREANAFRKKFQNCKNTKQLAVGTLDVSVRYIGRKLAPEIPDTWRKAVESTSEGGTTPIKVTDRGVEFIAVCSARTVSDDKAAVLSFMDDLRKNSSAAKLSKKYLAELKSAAKINR
jgi:peptidyl-prolyl cis-trans isomerase SurA